MQLSVGIAGMNCTIYSKLAHVVVIKGHANEMPEKLFSYDVRKAILSSPRAVQEQS
jgi:hypothetical protein